MKITRQFLSLFVIAVLLSSCTGTGGGENYDFPEGEEPEEGPVTLEDEDILQEGYPSSVSLYSFTDYFDDGGKCVGWYAVVDTDGDAVVNAMHFSPAKTPEGIYAELSTQGMEPLVVTNGGYFYSFWFGLKVPHSTKKSHEIAFPLFHAIF